MPKTRASRTSPNPMVGKPNASMIVAPSAATKVAGGCFVKVMPKSVVDNIPPGLKLDALTAEKVFGWQNIHTHQGAFVGKKQDRAGRWRLAKIPFYSTNPIHAYSIEERMKQVGRLDQYLRELHKITTAKNIPSDWATPDQRCRAAIKVVGRYGQVISLSLSRKQIQR